MVTPEAEAAVLKAQERYQAARKAMRDAESNLIAASRDLSHATKQWEGEYFKTAPMRG